MSLFDDAVIFAAEKHAGMRRKDGSMPYLIHPLEAALIASGITEEEEILAACVLHDTVEDTEATKEDILSRFGSRVAALVDSETEDKMPDLPPEESWQIRKEQSLDELKNAADPGVRILWLADKLSNLRSLYRLKEELGDRVWEQFHQKDPARHAWYYRSVDRALLALSETDAWKEYHDLVEKLFSDVK